VIGRFLESFTEGNVPLVAEPEEGAEDWDGVEDWSEKDWPITERQAKPKARKVMKPTLPATVRRRAVRMVKTQDVARPSGAKS